MNNVNPLKSWARLLDTVLAWQPLNKNTSPDSSAKIASGEAQATKSNKLTRLSDYTRRGIVKQEE